MTTEWARLTQNFVRTRDNNNILIPIILYTDGVALGHLQNRKSIPVIGALGNCNNSLLRKDISKFIIGYIPFINNISKEMILNHLVTKCGLSKTKANNSISMFNLQIERHFWNEVFKPINNCYRNGCLVHILGQGIKCIRTCVPFTVGDLPAQLQMRHFYNFNSRLPCLICNYSLIDQQPYDEEQVPYKNLNDLLDLAISAEPIYFKDIARVQLTPNEVHLLKQCNIKCIRPLISPFIGELEMGIDNDMNNYIVDLLHVFCSGIMKAVLLWIVIIIHEISKSEDKNFNKSIGVLDDRLVNFPMIPEVPHVNKCYFRKGLSFIVATKSKKERTLTTGSTGGFKSLDYVSALVQMYFVIGNNGDILPNTNNYSFRRKGKRGIYVGNVTKKVLNTIAALLDCYFLCKKDDGYTNDQCNQLNQVSNAAHSHILILWNLKERILHEESVKMIPSSLKLHLLQHVDRCARLWGSFSVGNTESYEHYHIGYTKNMYEETNKYTRTQNKDMLKLNITNMYLNFLKYMCYINYGDNYNNTNNYITRLIPPTIKNDNIEYQAITNLKHIPLVLNRNSDTLEIVPGHQKYSKLEDFLLHNTLNAKQFNEIMKANVQDLHWNNIGTSINIKLLHGIKYKGTVSSGLGEGYLYSTPDYGHTCRRIKRYDFVDVDIGDNNSQPAKILTLIELSLKDKILHFAIIQYIRKVETTGKPFFTCVWEYINERTNKHQIALISINSILRPAVVIPMMHLKVNPIKSKRNDMFWYIPIKFFDRTGWLEDLTTVINDTGLALGDNNQREYLSREASITFKTVTNMSSNDDDMNRISDDDAEYITTDDDDDGIDD